MFKLVHYEARTVGILLECFLINICSWQILVLFLNVHIVMKETFCVTLSKDDNCLTSCWIMTLFLAANISRNQNRNRLYGTLRSFQEKRTMNYYCSQLDLSEFRPKWNPFEGIYLNRSTKVKAPLNRKLRLLEEFLCDFLWLVFRHHNWRCLEPKLTSCGKFTCLVATKKHVKNLQWGLKRGYT